MAKKWSDIKHKAATWSDLGKTPATTVICSRCHGDGKSACRTCAGSGECTACGVGPCSDCLAGDIDCENCDGAGVVPAEMADA